VAGASAFFFLKRLSPNSSSSASLLYSAFVEAVAAVTAVAAASIVAYASIAAVVSKVASASSPESTYVSVSASTKALAFYY